MSKKKGSGALQWIIKEAKRIRRAHPRKYKKWTAYTAEASANYRKKNKAKVSAVKIIERGETRSTRPDRVVRVTRKKSGQYKSFKQIGGFDRITVVKQIGDTIQQIDNIDRQRAILKNQMKNSRRDPKGHPKNPNEKIQFNYLGRLKRQKEKQLSDLKRLL
jgi:hypothetical protein